MTIGKDAYLLYKERGPDGAGDAMALIDGALNDDPTDHDALLTAAVISYDAGRFGQADVFLSRALSVNPASHAAWFELGRARHMMQRDEAAAKCYVNSMRCVGDNFAAYNALILMNNLLGKPERALELAQIARFLAMTPDDARDLNGNVAISCLKLRRWAAGWANYDAMLLPGLMRGKITYQKDGRTLPDWDGTPGGEIIVYGEQGIGDETMFASMIPDLMATGTTPIIHCDRRLETLFRRSFDCPVYGGRGKKQGLEWLQKHNPKAAVAIGSLGQWFRRKESDFPRVPFLKADPEKRAMVRALLQQWPGRKIGLAWTAGTRKTRTTDRSVSLAELEPILSMPNATFVSLEYKGGAPSDPRIKHLPFLTQSQDYDDTAALVAELDSIVSVTTSVAHLAGAIGTPTRVMVPQAPTWHWCQEGDMPWHPIKSYRRRGTEWLPVIDQIRLELDMEAYRADAERIRA